MSNLSRSFATILLSCAAGAIVALPALADSQARIVRLSDVHGSVQIDKNSGLGFENAFLNLPITQGTQLKTRDTGRAEIEFEDGSTLRLAPNTTVEFSSLSLSDAGQRISVVNLIEGVAYVNWLGKGADDFTLNFSREKLSLDHAAHFRVETSTAAAKLAVFKGDLAVDTPSGKLDLAKKKTASFDAGDDDKYTVANNVETAPLDSWDKEAISYHDQYARNNSSPYGYGASDMNYYGSYTNVAGYGPMWQPYFAGVSWDPFMDGAWSWYPGYGYSFVSAYPWGWLPYRYGSWNFIPGNGWMWQPGGWNTWVGVPRFAGVAPVQFRAPVSPSGTVKTVNVGKGGTVLSSTLPSRLVVNRGSAGLGVPRGSVGNLHSLNSEVAKRGYVSLHSTSAFSGSSGRESTFSASHTASSPAPSATHSSSPSSSHASSSHH
jgi:FecR protein